MEGIELEAHHETEFKDVGLMAELDHNAKVSSLMVLCVLLILKVLYCRAQEYDTTLTSELGFTTHSAWCGCATQ
eukprot:3327852-Rhodomonas_salina.1